MTANHPRAIHTEQFGVELDARSNVAWNDDWATNVAGVFVAGDMGRGQSLIVWAIAEGRACASAVDDHLMDSMLLPRPLEPSASPIPYVLGARPPVAMVVAQ